MSSAKVSRIAMWNGDTSFATAVANPPAANDDWVQIPTMETPLPTLGQNVDGSQIANNRGIKSQDYATTEDCALNFSTLWHTGTAALDDGGAALDTNPNWTFMEEALESFHAAAVATSGPGTTLAAGGTTSIPKLTSGTGVNVGDCLGICASNQSVADNMDVVFVTALSGVDATVDIAVASAAAGNLVYSAFNVAPVLGEAMPYLYLNVERSGRSWLLGPGRINGLKWTFTPGGLLKADWSYVGDRWAAGVTPTTIYNQARSYFTGAPIKCVGGGVWINGTRTRIANASVQFNVKHEPIVASSDSTSGSQTNNGRAGWELTEMGISGDFEEYALDARFTTHMKDRTLMPLKFVWTVGTTNQTKARGTIALYVPQAQVWVEESTINGQVSQKTKWEAVDLTAAQVTAGITKPYYFAFLGGAAVPY